MKVCMATTKKDISAHRIETELKQKGLTVVKYLYEKLSEEQNISLPEFDFYILRDPFNTSRDYSAAFNLLKQIAGKKLLDYRVLIEHPNYEDKLYQFKLFSQHIPVVKCWYCPREIYLSNIPLPVIAKKRISSRGRHVFLLKTREELKKFANYFNLNDYIFQPFLELDMDIRIFVVNNQPVISVERKVRFKNKHGFTNIGVKVTGLIQATEKEKNIAVKAAKIYGADFCGIDIAKLKHGGSLMLECNISPQFVATESATKENIAERLASFIVHKLKNELQTSNSSEE